MARASSLRSIFSQGLDRAVFGTYFLGAVVPLVALGVVAHRYALPGLADDSQGTLTLVGVISGVAVLSLASFLALRRITRTALERMDADNARLATLLATAAKLSRATHASEASSAAVHCALRMTDAGAAFTLLRTRLDKPLTISETAGEDSSSLYEAHREKLDALAETAMAQGRPAVLDPGSGGELRAAAVLPLEGDGPSGVLALVGTAPGARFSPEQVDAASTLAALAAVAIQNADLQNAQRNFFAHVTDLLVTALDAHVASRRGHAQAVARLANQLGRELELEEGMLQRLHFAALLHDIGMLKIDVEQQRNPAFYQKHPMIGYRLLSPIRLWQEVAPSVLHHHEWYDGSGYPEGLRGEDIPFEARVIAVADAFDAMRRDDPDRRGRSHSESVEEIRRGEATQFDPEIVRAFLRLAGRGEL
jgi:HD-GYP domain-containing protein (c-di-GMP phosphodiesterase class II)